MATILSCALLMVLTMAAKAVDHQAMCPPAIDGTNTSMEEPSDFVKGLSLIQLWAYHQKGARHHRSAAQHNIGRSSASSLATSYHAEMLDPDNPYECIQTIDQYAHAFEKRADANEPLLRSACVTNKLYALVHYSAFPNDDSYIKPQWGRRVAFAFGSETLEKVLIYGKNGGSKIVDALALGPVVPGTYYLMIWKQDDPDAPPVPTPGYWLSLQPFLSSIYHDGLPNIVDAVRELKSTTFAQLTGCNATILHRSQIPDFKGANCSAEFMEAIELFPFNKKCDAPEKFYGSFKTTCVQEQNFLDLEFPSAVQLRAFLFVNNGFNGFYTGYGYTAEEYGDPSLKEYWIHNLQLKFIPGGYRDIEFEVQS